MKDLIAYCGIDCKTCEARIATVNDDDELRSKVSKLWSELNDIEHQISVKRRALDDLQKQFDIYKVKMESMLYSQLEIIKTINKDNQ